LLTCVCRRGAADVTVAIGAAHAHARAAVDVLERREMRDRRKSGAGSNASGNLTNRAEPQ
jgi:hypothetical protein